MIAFIRTYPVLAMWIVIGLAIVVAAVVMALLDMRRRRRAEDQRVREAMMRSASQVPPPWPRPAGPKGFNQHHRNGGGHAA